MKKITIALIIILLVLLSMSFLLYKEEIININTKDENIITNLQKKYNNNDIVGVLEIPDVLKTVVVQATDNEYYLTHNIKKENSDFGAVFMDYRVSLGDRKVLIYGHNSTRGNNLPFTKLDNYINEDFYKKHSKMYLYTNNKTYIFDIFSSYIEDNDFDYMNINSYNGLTYLQHINKLKNKSLYNTSITLNKNSKIIILQTCNVNTGYNESGKYTLVLGVLNEN